MLKPQYVYVGALTLCFLSLVVAAVITSDLQLLDLLFYALIGILGGLGYYQLLQILSKQ